ncbi:MAG: SMP-30/gluconolactonase/LRE family protein [Novosphingobium sp.]|nr:SMP-30/gluconolactonase/LRE family protein [Novosphingobium sp.]
MRTIRPEVQRIGEFTNTVGETPVWSVADQSLTWINCEDEPELLRWDHASGEITRWPMPERIGGFVFRQGGGALVVLADGLYNFDFSSGDLSLRVRSPLSEPVALHECACDPSGRFWVGGMNQTIGAQDPFPGGAKLFRLDGDRLVAEIDDMSCTNGLAFSADGKTLYVSDSTTQRCDRYAVDQQTGALGERETFFQLQPDQGFVDGATVDSEGAYWCPLVYTGKLRRYLPDGTPDLEVELPFANPTKVAFGGPDMKTMFVTSTAQSVGTPVTPLDGGLFRFLTDYTGRPDPKFAG